MKGQGQDIPRIWFDFMNDVLNNFPVEAGIFAQGVKNEWTFSYNYLKDITLA